VDAYGLEAEFAARQAEFNRREAAVRRAAFDAAPVRRPDESLDPRLAQLAERERAVAEREQLILTLEARLDESRRRLEERLRHLGTRNGDRLPPVPAGYFERGSYPNEEDWWAMRLGKRPQLIAI
jgi:hypothetical protein